MDIKAILRAREAFFTDERSDSTARQDGIVRPEILVSWRRTRQHGVTPDVALPRPGPAPASDGQLLRAARSVVTEHHDVLADTPCAITLTDPNGTLLDRWVRHQRFANQLDELGLHPGCDISEAAVGTSSTSIALEALRAVQVTGPEHIAAQAVGMTTGSAIIRQPASKKVLGVVGIVGGFVDSKPLLLSWIREIAAAVEREILASSFHRQASLLSDFLKASADARHPVLCLDDNTVIGNATAMRLLNSLDQAVVWKMAADAALTADSVERILVSSTSQRVRVGVIPIKRGGRAVASEVRLNVVAEARRPARITQRRPQQRPQTRRADVNAPAIPGLVGLAPSWVEVCEQLGAAWDQRQAVVLVGEPGTGKTALVEALAADRGSTIHRCVNVVSLEEVVRIAPDGVLLEDVDDLDVESRGRTAGLLARLPGTTAVVMTTVRADSPASRLVVAGRPSRVLSVPPLRERPEDMPLLLDALTHDATGHDHGPRWLPETVQTLSRIHWRSNIASLRTLVLEILERDPGPCVRVDHLAPELLVQAARRPLSPIEEAEVLVVMRAIRDADGNKKLAASALGVARSTLYRKIRSLGLDLSVANY